MIRGPLNSRNMSSIPSLFDTHAHLDMALHQGALDGLLKRAVEAGVKRIMAVGGSLEANVAALEAANRYPRQIRAAVGYDRDQAASSLTRTLWPLEDPPPPSVLAIGEIGLDYFYSAETASAQRVLFETQLAWARTTRLPIIVHSRAADADTLALLQHHAAAWPADPAHLGVLHCFTGNREFAHALLDLGFHLSFSGILTFRNAEDLRDVAREVPDERLLIESDTPYLAPEPRRGHPNEPAYLHHTLDCLARLRDETPAALSTQLTANAVRLFAWPSSETPCPDY